jgi:hypothetical protein
MKLTELQKHEIRAAYSSANAVLQQIKRKTLTKKEIEFMKILESAVSNLELCMIMGK